MKTKILALFYVDINGNQGDSIRVRETVHYLGAVCDLQVVCVNAAFMKGKVRCFHVPKFKRGMAIIWNLASLFYGVLACFQLKPQLIYSDACPGSLSPAILSYLMGVPLVIEMHTPAGAQDVTLYRAGLRTRIILAKWIERLMLRRARLIIASEGWANLVKQTQQLLHNQIVTLPLAVNHKVFHPLRQEECRQQLKLPISATIAIWVGNIGPWQGIDTLIKAALLMVDKNPDIIFLIVGDGASRADLMVKVKELGISALFRFTGSVTYEQVATYIGAADVGLALFPGNRGFKGGISAHKTLNYLACGRPVIASNMEEMAMQIDKFGAGKVILPDDPQQLAEALLWAVDAKKNGNSQLLQNYAMRLGELLPTWQDRVSFVMKYVEKVIL